MLLPAPQPEPTDADLEVELEPQVEVVPDLVPLTAPEPLIELVPEVVEKPRLRDRLGRTRAAFSGVFTGMRGHKIDDATWEDLEEAMLLADVGLPTTERILDEVRARAKAEGAVEADALVGLVRDVVVGILDDGADRELHVVPGEPNVWMFVGVNGVGKTTTIGKLAGVQVADGRKVVLAAADTFRAAAADQLGLWAERAGGELVRGQDGADPGSVVFDAMAAASSRHADLVLVDTAGRLHTNSNLMEELQKLRRIVDRTEGALQRSAPRDRRDHRSERVGPGQAVRRRGRGHGHRAHQARRNRQGRDRAGDPVGARACRSRSSGWGRPQPTSCSSIPASSRPRCLTPSARLVTSRPRSPPRILFLCSML